MEWLHFCDFHIGGPRGPQAEVLKSLLDRVRNLNGNTPNRMNAVFLVGDIAFSGSTDEYTRFTNDFLRPLLEIPSVAGAKVFAVPENHDVDCERCLPITWEGIQRRNQELFFIEDDQGKKVRRSRVEVFEGYRNFTQYNNIISPDPFEQVSVLYEDSALPVGILATNTAFFSDKSEDSSKPATPVPLSSLRHHIKPGAPTQPLIILGHHSPSSLMTDHERQLRTLLSDKKAVLLHGHEHDPKAVFNPDGTLRSLGFGASYLGSLGGATESPYLNSFAHCCIVGNKLRITSYSWEPTVGRWVDKTEAHFADCIMGDYKGYAVVNLPLLSAALPADTSKAITLIPRSSAKISRIIPVAGVNEDVWKQLFLLSENITHIYRSGEPQLRQLPQETEKAGLVLESPDRRDLFIQIPGINHVLSSKEIESFNTTLDTEGYKSVTVISLGKISDEAQAMYLRLRTRKPLEVLTNKQLLAGADKILSDQQNAALGKLDPARHFVDVLLCANEILMLVLDRTEKDNSFFILKSDGSRVPPTDPLVLALRQSHPEFDSMRYAGECGDPSEPASAFDRAKYLEACHKEYNVVKYAGLANIGIRFSDLPLETLYVSAKASEVDEGQASRLEAVVADHLATYPVSEALKAHVQQQLLASLKQPTRAESSMAQEFCQKYGAVLLTGDPGSGKTCFIKNEILTYCKDGLNSADPKGKATKSWYASHIPVMLQLSELVAEPDFAETDLFALASRLLARRGFNIPGADLQRLSREGAVAWFFDGLDEVVSIEKRAAVVQHINRLVTEFLPIGNRIVVTSRPAAVHVVNLLPSLHRLELQGFTETEIRVLAERILRIKLADSNNGVVLDEARPSSGSATLISQLIQDCHANPGVARLAQNPLLLTLLIMIYANSGAPEAKRHRIYEEAIKTLASVRGREAGHSPVSAQDLRERLGAVALSVYKKQSGLLPTREEVCELIRGVMSRQRGEEVPLAEASLFVQKVAESTGLIAVESRKGEGDEKAIVTFMHHSFLEYFAAIGLSRELDAFDLGKIVTQPRWHEILTLLSGIIGENEDVAPVLAKFLDSDGKDDVDAKVLLFAMDCALECEVPSDAAQRLLAKAIKGCLSGGPARIDPWVRSEIGQRLARILEVCGEANFEAMMVECLNHGDPNVCAAAINLAGYAMEKGYESPSVIEAINRSCARTEEPVLVAICLAGARAQDFRTKSVLQVIGNCLKKSPRSRRAAFEAISGMPNLASNYWPEIINGIEDANISISRWASLAALQAGLNADVIALSGNKKDILLRALKCIDEFGESDTPPPKVKVETIERMLGSAFSNDRVIAIQLVPMCEAEEQYKYEKLFGILKNNSDRVEVVAALTALRLSGSATALFTQADLKTVATWLDAGTQDVRIAAARLLGCFGGDMVSVEALLNRDWDELSPEDYKASVSALSHSRVLKDKAAEFLFAQLSYYLDDRRRKTAVSRDDRRKKTAVSLEKTKALLDALRRLRQVGAAAPVNKVKALVDDYKTDDDVKRCAMLCYPAIAIPSDPTVATVKEWFLHPPIGLDSTLVRVPSILARQCRESVDYVMACISALVELRKEMVVFHKQIAKRDLSDESEYNVTELRQGIDEVTRIIVAFDEFIQNGNGPKNDLPLVLTTGDKKTAAS